MLYRKGIYGIVVTAILLIGIAGYAVWHLAWLRNDSELYDNSNPAMYISQGDAVVYVTNEPCDAETALRYLLPETDVLQAIISVEGGIYEKKPTYVVCYPDGAKAVWQSVRPSAVEKITAYITDSLSDGYRPVAEILPQGSLLHYAMSDGGFLHVAILPGVIGYSYDLQRLIIGKYDKTLATTVDSTERRLPAGMYYCRNGKYEYADLYRTGNRRGWKQTMRDFPQWLSLESKEVDTTLIAADVPAFVQASCHTDSSLASTITLAVVRKDTDNTDVQPVMAIAINDEKALRERLRPYFTPDGYRMSQTELSALLPLTWLTEDRYWLAIRHNTLFASPSHTVLWQYIHRLQWGDRATGMGNEAAMLHCRLPMTNVAMLHYIPSDITVLLPPLILQDTIAVRISQGKSVGETW